MRKVSPSRGLDWIVTALRLFGRHFAVFFLMGIVVVLLGQVPVLGSLAMLVLGPAFSAGLVFAADRAAHGTPPRVGMLFKAFDGSHRLSSLIALCLPTLSLMVIVVFVVAGAMLSASGGDPARIQALQSDPGALVAALRGHLGALAAVAVAGGLLNLFLTLFAAPLVMLRQQGGFSAMAQSLRAALSNIGAIAVLIVGLMVLFMAVGLALGALMFALRSVGTWGPLTLYLFLLVLSVVFSALLMYAAWHDVFADDLPPQRSDSPAEMHAEM